MASDYIFIRKSRNAVSNVLHALLKQQDGLATSVLERLGVNPALFSGQVEGALKQLRAGDQHVDLQDGQPAAAPAPEMDFASLASIDNESITLF